MFSGNKTFEKRVPSTCNKPNWFFAELEKVGWRTEAPGLLLLIIKTHQPGGGVDTSIEITPYPGSCVFFQPSITLCQQTLYTEPAKRKLAFPRGNFTFVILSWTSWKTCTHSVHSPKVIKIERFEGWHCSDRLWICRCRLVDESLEQWGLTLVGL